MSSLLPRRVKMERQQKPITIVGRGSSWYNCPFEDEVWGTVTCLATEGLKDKPYSKVFAFDEIHYLIAKGLDVAKERGIPVVSTLGYATEKYPLLEIFNEFHTNYLKNTVSYMLALAISEGYNPLHIYGVEQTGIYEEGKPYVTFWLGIAMGRGIEYTISDSRLPHRWHSDMQNILDKINAPKIQKEVALEIK